MRYATPGAFRTALERRLLTTAQQAKVPVVRLRKLVVFDRLLARLLLVAPERWLLKGALALDLRLGARSRTTKDMDLARQDCEAAAVLVLVLEIQRRTTPPLAPIASGPCGASRTPREPSHVVKLARAQIASTDRMVTARRSI